MDAIEILTGALVGATIVLAAATIYYARQARLTVIEMRAARSATVRPRVTLAMTHIAPDVWFPTVVNVGSGPALNVDVDLSLEPGSGDKRKWRAPVLVPGDRHEFFMRTAGTGGLDHLGKVVEKYTHVALRGRCVDALGSVHRIDEQVELREWRELIEKGGERLIPDHLADIARSVKEIAKSLNK